MPILLEPNDAGLLGGLALNAGRAQGSAQVAAQLRQIGAHREATILEAQIRDEQEKQRQAAMQPQQPTEGTQGPVQTFTSDATAQGAKLYGTGAERQSREQAAQIFDTLADNAQDPGQKAAAQLAAHNARLGMRVTDQHMRMAGINSPADLERAKADAARQQEADRRAQIEQQRADQAAEAQRQKATGGPMFKSSADANAHDVAWNAPAQIVAQALQKAAAPPEPDPLTGQPDKAYEPAVSIRRMLNSEFRGKSTGQIMARLNELRQAGAPAQALQGAYQYVSQVRAKAEQVRDAVAKIASDSAGHVGSGKLKPEEAQGHRKQFREEALKRAGISEQDYDDYLTQEEQRAGLRPIR